MSVIITIFRYKCKLVAHHPNTPYYVHTSHWLGNNHVKYFIKSFLVLLLLYHDALYTIWKTQHLAIRQCVAYGHGALFFIKLFSFFQLLYVRNLHLLLTAEQLCSVSYGKPYIYSLDLQLSVGVTFKSNNTPTTIIFP